MKPASLLLSGIMCLLAGCNDGNKKNPKTTFLAIFILGVAQDAGYPQTGCTKECCNRAWQNPSLKRFSTSLALVDPVNKKWYLFEATPDIKEQLQLFKNLTDSVYSFLPDGIFLTHGHIGHYTGLLQLGREVMNTKGIPVYVMPRMKKFLSENGPWIQLVSLNNISLIDLKADSSTVLHKTFSIIPFLVPHRDEYTETAGFKIKANNYQTLFIPDIDKWEKFDKDISAMIKESNLALMDGTFYKDGELPGRPMSEVPHPFIEESIKHFKGLPDGEKKKIQFIHFNHTNPVLDQQSPEYKKITLSGFGISKQGEMILLK